MTESRLHLSPRQAALALGASESSLKRWVDAGDLATSRTAGGHRRIPAAEVLRFARREGLALRDPSLLGQTAPAAGTRLTTVVTRALLAGDGATLQEVLLRAHHDGVTVAALADGPLRTAMEELGRLWLHGEEGIAREHHATLLLVGAIEALRRVLPPADEQAPVALGGAPADDPYILPSLLVALVLQSAGWRTIDLGPDTPDGAVLAAAQRHGATLVWRSFTGGLDPRQASAALVTLCARLAPCRVIIGGRRARLLTGLQAVPNLERQESLAGLARLTARRR